MASVADQLRPFFETLLGKPVPLRIRLWDGSELGEEGGPATAIFSTPDALRRILYAPGELGFARAYVLGEVDVEGSLYDAIHTLATTAPNLRIDPRTWASTARTAVRLGVVGKPLPPPPEEAKVRGRLHSIGRDREAIAHHYDLSNEFYELILGPSMTYSCARFTSPDVTLEAAQEAKHELVSAKLGLRPGMRLLDVGCGWGGMVIHAARAHGVEAVGITISAEQHELARKRVAAAGLEDRVEIRLQDYRDLDDGPYDAISSIGMFEHVG
ncbi:MAG TPA: cyclopropane-fatty-acyl-phospholipid synthase family protein, partial [Acidimicrobiales bacterium]|nr:cyclopropane-fatty-acyl-phospholipid synthase family protein [Acidimicrobiales bacterium]